MRKTLTREERLSRQSQLKTVFATGSKKNTAGAKVVYLKNSLPISRFAITVVRKYGNAVERNWIKRQFREFYRNNKNRIPKGWDIIIVVYPGKYSRDERFFQFTKLLKKSGLLDDIVQEK